MKAIDVYRRNGTDRNERSAAEELARLGPRAGHGQILQVAPKLNELHKSVAKSN